MLSYVLYSLLINAESFIYSQYSLVFELGEPCFVCKIMIIINLIALLKGSSNQNGMNCFKTHTLVAEYFIEKPEGNALIIDHINHDIYIQ